MHEDAVDYRAWGEQFFATAVSEERLLGAVNALTGQPIDLGPLAVGPGGIAKLQAHGAIGEATATRARSQDPRAPIAYRVTLPAELAFEIDLSVEVQRFHAHLAVPLVLSAVALDRVRIFVDIAPPRAADIAVRVQGENLRAELLKRVANIEGELARFVARYIVGELDKPRIQEARMIDVGAMIDKAWDSLKPKPAPPEGVVADLADALEKEVAEHEDLFLDGS